MSAAVAVTRVPGRLRRSALVDSPWWVGARDARASMVALAPIGVIAGAAGAEASGPTTGWLGGPLLVSATAHFAVLSMAGAGTVGILAVVAVLQSRCAIYGAALAPRFVDQPRWFRWFGAYLLVDQTFALVDARRDEYTTPEQFRSHYLGVTIPLMSYWLVVMAIGAGLGTVLPADLGLELIAIALVVALLQPALTTATARRGALVGGVVTAGLWYVPHGGGMLVGAVVGMIVAAHTARGH